MPIFNKESLETLRQRVNLVDFLSPYVELKRSGSSYKGCCPFHDEKTPSFVIQNGESHYHCFGCGAHGDAIQFLMMHQKLSFAQAIELLAERFHVHLETVEENEPKGVGRGVLKQALSLAAQFYHFCLLHTPEGHSALHYLYRRGIDLNFIRHFQLGYAPKRSGVFRKVMHAKKVSDEALEEAGLLGKTQEGKWRDFFSGRILFPIYQLSDVIGFSARKFNEETFGGKYVNTPQTPLFKKSKVLFGFNYSRKRIAKERRAIVVEGQIDALRLIYEGVNIAVAGQGTAFGEEHAKELIAAGAHQIFLALDSDKAGQEATVKIGQLFQKEGVEVRVIALPEGQDPDSFVRSRGVTAFLKLMEESVDYLTFFVSYLSKTIDTTTPEGKNELIGVATRQIREWNHPVIVHETLRKLAHMMKVPENYLGIDQETVPHVYIKKSASVGMQTIDPDRILETDLLRWLLLLGQEQHFLVEIARANLSESDFQVPICRKLYATYMERVKSAKTCDLLSLAIDLNDAEGQLVLSDLVQKKVNKEKAKDHLIDTIQKILDRNWMQKREVIKMRIHSGQCSDEEAIELAKQFDSLKKNPPKVLKDPP